MKRFLSVCILALISFSCGTETETDKYPINQTNWENRRSKIKDFSPFHQGKTYLPIYSHIYHSHEHRTFDLTTTVSIRNLSIQDSLYLLKADYYNTVGENIRHYVKNPIYIKPLETLEIVIHEKDFEGGSGANFLFDWAMRNDKNPPLFEAVMISSYGQQGLSFIVRGINVSQ